jgi:hypothetical protein
MANMDQGLRSALRDKHFGKVNYGVCPRLDDNLVACVTDFANVIITMIIARLVVVITMTIIAHCCCGCGDGVVVAVVMVVMR